MDDRQIEVLESIHRFIEDQYPRRAKLTSIEFGDGFCKWCLREIFELAEDQAEEAMAVSGPADNGMDAVFDQEDHLYVVQAKYGKAHSFEAVAGFVERVRQLKAGQVSGQRPEVLQAAASIQDHLAQGKRVFFYYITNAVFSKGDQNRIGNLTRSLGSSYKVLDLPQIVEILTDRVTDLPESFRKKVFRLRREQPPIEVEGTLAMSVRLADLAEFVGEAKDFLFHANIRNYLRRTSINKGIEETLSNEPEKFWMYNNGITVVCDEYWAEGDAVRLRTPQIVNGCQTATTVANFLKSKTSSERAIFPGRVLVRVIKNTVPEERANITRFTNSQNAVKGKDFLSLDRFQRNLQSRMASSGYFYEIQRGSFAIMDRARKLQYRGDERYDHLTPNKPIVCIHAPEAVQGYVAAFLQMPHVAYGRPSELMPLGGEYKNVFNDDTPEEPEYFLLPPLVAAYAVQQFEYGHGGEGYRRYGRWFFVTAVFGVIRKALVSLGVLDDTANMTRIPASTLRSLFCSKELSSALLRLVEDYVLDRFFDDTAIKRLAKDDYWNFFKGPCATSQAREILKQKIDDMFERREGKSLFELVKTTLSL